MRALLILTALTLGWIAVALLAMLPGSIQTAAIPSNTTVPENIAIIGTAPGLLIVRGSDPNYVQRLYKAGATFVLPARQKTCLALQS